MHCENYFNFGQLLFRLNPPAKYLARQLEKSLKASVQVTYGVPFNIICLNEGLLSARTNIYIYIYIYTYIDHQIVDAQWL